MRTRSEHIAWCRERALAYVEAGDLTQAMSSLMSDLRKHPETADHMALELGGLLQYAGHLSTPSEVREWIEGVQ